MLVPRSFKYSSSPPAPVHDDEKASQSPTMRRIFTERPKPARVSRREYAPLQKTDRTHRTHTDSVLATPSKPVSIPRRSPSGDLKNAQFSKSRGQHHANRKSRAPGEDHRADAMPPAVAALLAVTAIPPPKTNQFRRRKSSQRQISIDELVQEWRSDDTLRTSYGSNTSLDLLLGSADEYGPEMSSSEGLVGSRSTSSESIPSLEADDRSVLSFTDPSTPESVRSRKPSSINSSGRRGKARLSPASEDCASDHPLILLTPTLELEDDFSAPPSSLLTPNPEPRRRSTFKSNLTSSLAALKTAALSSLSTLERLSAPPGSNHSGSSTFSDATLWAHPQLFPRFSPEVRPAAFSGTPTKSQRRYLNPTPLDLEGAQAHFQAALHPSSFPCDTDSGKDGVMIQMQTYSRNGRSSPSRRRARSPNGGARAAATAKPQPQPDPRSELGRALAGPTTVRQREPRENADFLRVVVLEMNMRREGKLEDGVAGRARIWLPPRKAGTAGAAELRKHGNVPSRWVGVSLDD